jgi:hypothetical protein
MHILFIILKVDYFKINHYYQACFIILKVLIFKKSKVIGPLGYWVKWSDF